MGRELKPGALRPFDRFALGALCLILALIFAYLSVFCLFYTSIFNPENIIFEHVLRTGDPVLLNLALVLCLALLVRLFLRFEKALSLRWCTGVFLGLVFLVGAVWVSSISALPRADSRGCYNAGVQLAFDQPLVGSLSYFQRYPFQAGYTLYCELFVRLFGEYCTPKIGYANALLLVLSYAALLTLLWDSRHNKRLQLCAIALLALLIQPLFYVTFVYGFVPGLALSLWALVLAQRWVRQRRWWQLPSAAVLCAVAIVLKPNYWIMALAIFLLLLLHCLSARQFRWLPLALLVVLLPALALSGVQRYFESRIGQKLGSGTPQTAWLAMGLQEGSRAAGWYNGYTGTALDLDTLDSQAAHQQAVADIRARLEVFAARPAYGASFFHNKMVSQWSETTFESLWINKTLKFTKDPPAAVQSILTGKAAPVLERYMDGFTVLLYLGFALGLLLWRFGKGARRRAWGDSFGLGALAVAIFGGWLYHMLFEAKSQYLVIYLPMMVPFGALALSARIKDLGLPSRLLSRLPGKKT